MSMLPSDFRPSVRRPRRLLAVSRLLALPVTVPCAAVRRLLVGPHRHRLDYLQDVCWKWCAVREDWCGLPRIRPLLIIHGLADDNVVVAHSLRLSSALLAAGRPHSVLPLSGVTHMATQEEVAENLLLLQVDFLRRALGPA